MWGRWQCFCSSRLTVLLGQTSVTVVAETQTATFWDSSHSLSVNYDHQTHLNLNVGKRHATWNTQLPSQQSLPRRRLYFVYCGQWLPPSGRHFSTAPQSHRPTSTKSFFYRNLKWKASFCIALCVSFLRCQSVLIFLISTGKLHNYVTI